MRNFINLRRMGTFRSFNNKSEKNYTITNETDTGGVAEECYKVVSRESRL